MRKIRSVLVAAMLLFAGNILANDVIPTKKLSTQIAELLEDNPFVLSKDDLTANVLFTLNDKKEIVVLSVETEDKGLEAFVKSRLNYKQVESSDSENGKTFRIPVRITP